VTTLTLRTYQIDAIQQARDRIRQGRRAPLLVAPTGAGKSAIAGAVIIAHLAQSADNRVLVVAHRRELIQQLAKTLIRMGVPMIDIGEIIPGVTQRPSARVQVASTQTLRARAMAPKATLVIYDEAHHYSSDDWHELTKAYPGVVRVGFTATPMRSDGRGMAPAFDSLVVVSTIKELTALAYLVPCRVIAPGKPLRRPNMSHTPVDAYIAHAKGMRTVVFADFVANAEMFVEQFREKGIDAVIIHGQLSDVDRRRALDAHAAGAVLVNCMVLTEGWDSPGTSCCILARGCGSVGTYLQIVGRVLRPSPGKTEALLIDLTGRSYYDHGAPDTDRTYSLLGKGIRTKADDEDFGKPCPVCGQPIVDGEPCSVCGFIAEGSSTIEDPRYTGDELAERYAGKRTEDDEKRIDTLARWYSEAKARGNRPWAAAAKYAAVYGGPPPESVRLQAELLSRTMACVTCVECNKVTARTYAGGKCGRCAFGKRKAG
jgi:superfamily II DNA or RNA helicase